MKKILVVFALLLWLAVPASAYQITAPEPSGDAEHYMQNAPESFGEGLAYILRYGMQALAPELYRSLGTCVSLLATALILSILKGYDGRSRALVDLAGVIGISCTLLGPTNTMIDMAANTVKELSEYGKTLLPVITAALASQGGGTTASGIYIATAFFNALLCSGVEEFLVPALYIYLAIATVNAAVSDPIMEKLKDLIKWLTSWGLKLVLYAFTGYVTITGVVNGTADQTAIKAAKITIGGMIPVVGGIMSDASETILVSAAVVKNAVGVYGLLALIAIAIVPLAKLGVHYLLLKITAAVCGIFSEKPITKLIDDFSAVMGLLLAMAGTVCLLLLISTVSFLKGMG